MVSAAEFDIPLVATLDDAIKTSELVADSVPVDLADLRDEVLLIRSQDPPLARRIKNRFPGLSPNYLRIVESVRIGGVSLGLIELSPGRGELSSAISAAQLEHAIPNRVVVARHHGDLIVLSETGRSDEMRLIDHATTEERLLAESFEQLIVLASIASAARETGAGPAAAHRSIESLLAGSPLLGLWRSLLVDGGMAYT